jgi:hypothetical protein
VISIQQTTGDDLLVAQHFAVADFCGQIPVCCRSQDPALWPQPCGELLSFKAEKSLN